MVRSFRHVQLFALMLLETCWIGLPGILSQDPVVSGPIVTNACFGSDGLDLIANVISCSPDERVCIENIRYGNKQSRPDGSCPHAIGFSVSKECCAPEPGDCVVAADSTKLSDLREECFFRNPSGCTLRADRINMGLACPGSSFGHSFSTFRSITYSCVPDSLAELVDDPCLAIPERPNTTDISNVTVLTNWPSPVINTQPIVVSPSPVDQGIAPVMIGAIVGGSLFFMACLVLIVVAIKLKRRRTKREADSTEKLSELGVDLAETGKHSNGIPYGHSPFYGKSKGFNVYVPYTREDFKLVKTRPVVGVNVDKSSHKKYSRNVSQTSDVSNVSDETKVTRSPPPGYRSRVSSQGSRVQSTKSSPPGYRSRASSCGSRTRSDPSQERNIHVSFEMPEKKPLPTREYAGEWKKLTDSLDNVPVHRL